MNESRVLELAQQFREAQESWRDAIERRDQALATLRACEHAAEQALQLAQIARTALFEAITMGTHDPR